MKREVRVEVTRGSIKWQFKRKDEERWDYDSPALPEDWDELEDIMMRRAGRGRSGNMIEVVRKMRRNANG